METSTSATSQATNLDARQLASQLPPGFPRADEAAIDAVMQLARFTEQQQQHTNEQQQAQTAKPSRKRKAADGAPNTKGSIIKTQEHADTESSSHVQNQNDDSHQNNWASFTGSTNEFEQMLQQNAQQQQEQTQDGGEQDQALSVDQQQQHMGEESGEILTRHGRPLSTTKRAAQNRAAQRAFRERRDQHFKDVEAKAKQVDAAIASATAHKQRYDDLLRTIAGLRQDNQSLRLAINALGGNPPPPPAAATSFPNVIEEDTAKWLQDLDGSQQDTDQGKQGINGDSHDSHLEGLSAVAAAAAAAAAAHAVGQGDEDKADANENVKEGSK